MTTSPRISGAEGKFSTTLKINEAEGCHPLPRSVTRPVTHLLKEIIKLLLLRDSQCDNCLVSDCCCYLYNGDLSNPTSSTRHQAVRTQQTLQLLTQYQPITAFNTRSRPGRFTAPSQTNHRQHPH